MTRIDEVVWTLDQRPRQSALVLGRGNLDHRVLPHLQHGIAPESVPKVTVEFLLQRELLARFIVKQADVLLAVGGVLEVMLVDSKAHSAYFRSRDQVKYEIAISTDGRYALTASESLDGGRLLRLRYTKLRAALPPADQIGRWTFGIVTNGKKTANVHALVRSIVRQNIPECEILVCGPYEFEADMTGRGGRVLDDVRLSGGDIRAPLAAKKNRLIEAARHNNLCILHDRFLLPEDWYRRFQKYGNYFDLLCLRTVDQAGNRFEVDWMTFCNPVTRTMTRNGPLQYAEWSGDAIMQGGVIVAKKSAIDRFRLDERLHWEELEDMQFSKQAILSGALINVDPNNYFISEAVNHRPVTGSGAVHRVMQRLAWYRGVLASYVKFQLWQTRQRLST